MSCTRRKGRHIILAPTESVSEELNTIAEYTFKYHRRCYPHCFDSQRKSHGVRVIVVLHVAHDGTAVAGDGGDIVAVPAKLVGAGFHDPVVRSLAHGYS